MSSNHETFISSETASLWRFISSSISHLVDLVGDLSDEELAWRPSAPAANSLGVLTMHTLGNLEENVIQTLCGEPVHRQREAEFRLEQVTAADLQARWSSLRQSAEIRLAAFTTSDLDHRYFHPRRGELTGREVLIVVARHAAEHLGQAELTRDLLRASQL